MLVTVVRTELKLNGYKEASHCVTVIITYYLCNETAGLLFVFFVKHSIHRADQHSELQIIGMFINLSAHAVDNRLCFKLCLCLYLLQFR